MESSSPPRSPPLTYMEMLKLPIVRRPNLDARPKFEPQHRTPPSSEPPPEPSDAAREKYHERWYPYHLLAMRSYNERRKEGEEQYKLIQPLWNQEHVNYFGNCGWLFTKSWLAQPTSIEKVDKSAFKHFYARLHQISSDNIHVASCDFFPGDPNEIDQTHDLPHPICCEICGLMNQDDFKQKDQEIEEQCGLKRGSVLSLSRPRPTKECGPLDNLKGGQKIRTSGGSSCDEGGVVDKETHKRKAYDEGDEVQVKMDRMKAEEAAPPPPREHSMIVLDELRRMHVYMEEQFTSIHREQARQRDAIDQLCTNFGITNRHGVIPHPHMSHGDEDKD